MLEAQWPTLREVAPEDIADALGDLVPPVDRAALTGDLAESMADDLHVALSEGIWGWHDDDLAFTRPWGFELDAIRVPLSIWQGEQDRMVPFAHGVCSITWCHQLPYSTAAFGSGCSSG